MNPQETDALFAKMDLCLAQTKEATAEAARARAAAESTHAVVTTLKAASTKLASDHMELRTGIPPEWRRRAILVSLAGAFGGMAGAAVVLVWFAR